MTTFVLCLLAVVVVAWVVAKAARTDRTDETDRFAHVQEIVGAWSDEAAADGADASQSRNDLANNS